MHKPAYWCWSEMTHSDLILIFMLAVVDAYQAWCGPCKTVVDLFRRIRNEVSSDLLHFAVVRSHLALLKKSIFCPLNTAGNWSHSSFQIHPEHNSAGVPACVNEPAGCRLVTSKTAHTIKDFQAWTILYFSDVFLQRRRLEPNWSFWFMTFVFYQLLL